MFSLSSGTLGGALEAAVCKRRAIALSYAFFSRNHDPEIIAGASKLSVKLIDYLYKNWDAFHSTLKMSNTENIYLLKHDLFRRCDIKEVYLLQSCISDGATSKNCYS